MRLDPGVRKLVVELARAQNFKCAFCDATRGLIIEHDHYPERGTGDKPTVYNIRGLACSGCNWHLGMYEADERGDYRGFDDAFRKPNCNATPFGVDCARQLLRQWAIGCVGMRSIAPETEIRQGRTSCRRSAS